MRSMAGETQLMMQLDPDEDLNQPPAKPVPRLQVLSERPLAPKRAVPTQAPAASTPLPLPVPAPPAADLAALQRATRVAAALGTFDAIAKILSTRAILLLSVAGAFGLAAEARDLVGGSIFGGFCALVVIPLIWLDHTTRRPPGG